MRSMKSFAILILIFSAFVSNGQVIWQDNFNNNCSGKGACSYLSNAPYNNWTVKNGSTHNAAQGNEWFVSSSEAGGIAAGTCGKKDGTDGTLHISNVANSPLASLACPTGDCGAAYDGGYNLLGDVTTDTRAVTPLINCTGYNGTISVSFLYIENGQDKTDNFTLDYSPDGGATWSQLADPAKTVSTSCPTGESQWTAFTIPLPASAKNNPNVKIGFHWINNNDATGSDPSVAIDNVVVCQESIAADFNSSATTICLGETVQFTDNSHSGCGTIKIYSWTFQGGTPANYIGANPPAVSYSAAGPYNVQLFVQDDHNNSNTLSRVAYITVQTCTAPTVDFTGSPSSVCENECVSFNDIVSGGKPPYTYAWTFQGGNPATATAAKPQVCYATAGSYTVQLTVTDASGSTASKSIPQYITVTKCGAVPVIDFLADKTTICYGECVQFTDLSTNTPTSWNWSFNPNSGVTPSNPQTQNPSVCFSTPGVYEVTLQASNAIGPGTAKTKTAYITVNSCLVTDFSVNPGLYLCTGECIAAFTDLSTSGSTIDTWLWTFDGGTIAGTTSNTYLGQTPPQVCYNTPGVYSVKLYCHDVSNNSQTKQEFITVEDCTGINPKGSSSDSVICTSSCITFSDLSTTTTGDAIVGWEWTFDGADPPKSTAQNPSLVCYPTGGIYPVRLKVYTASAVDSATLSFTIMVNDPTPVKTNFDAVTVVQGNSQSIIASGGVSYIWTDMPSGTLNYYNGSSVLASPQDTTYYTVSMTDATGCTSSKTVVINVVPPNLVWTPNAFAPGGLPENKIFRVYTSGLVNTLELKIFDRWGELVFSTTDPNGFWDGSYKGVNANTGVYVFFYKVTFQDGTEVKQSGDVTLLR